MIRVPATPGRETAPTLVLQGHLDMVCERDPSSPNDPAEGRIALVRDGEWLTADGTTLGADDGVAIAAMMALVEDESLPHGPLELLMTVAEEVGLEGANALDPALITGSILINLDSEEDGRPDRRVRGEHGHVDPDRRAASAAGRGRGDAVGRRSSGGQGGHSGVRHRARAVERGQGAGTGAARGPCESVPFRLVSLDGGKSRNAIPRDAVAVCSVPARSASRRSGRRVERRRGDDPRRVREDRLRVSRSPSTAAEAPADAVDGRGHRRRCSTRSRSCRPGPLAMSPDFDDLVETSTSLGEAITDGDRLTLHSLSRSSNDSALPEVIATLDAAARLARWDARGQAQLQAAGGPDLDSPALAVARSPSTSGSSASRRS